MRLNLGCGQDIRSGYTNVDKLPPGQVSADVYKQGDVESLDWLATDGSVDEIVALDCLEYLPIASMKPAITNWIQKLNSGGILKIMVPDCHAVAQAFAQGQLNLQEYLQITFGTQSGVDSRMSAIDGLTLLAILQEAGLTITLKRYEGVAIYVEAQK